MYKNFILLLILIFFIACSKNIAPTTTVQYSVFDEKAKLGFELMKTRCTSCHSFKSPYTVKKEKWENVFPAMFKKAKMTDTTEQNLIKYFVFNNLQRPGE